jgi:transcription-repair coupling factor (superfamily II helicase)
MKPSARSPAELLAPGHVLTLANVAEGAEGLVVSDLARSVAARAKPPAISLAVVCRDGPRMQQLARALDFFAPDLPVMQFPAWDCQPYDRASPHGAVLAQRLTTLARLARLAGSDKPLLVLTTVNAIVQRVPARDTVAAQALSVAPGHVVPMDSIVAWLEHNGYGRSSTVREAGEYAVRGGILDLFPAGLEQPVRFDFFGDSLESIRSFDAETQRTLLDMRSLDLVPISEFQLVTETIRRFRMGYTAEFGAPERDDQLYQAVTEGRRHPGMEHWLPLFQDRMNTLFDYLGDAPVAIEPQGEDAARERFKQIADYYEARREALEQASDGALYKPLPPDRLYLTEAEWRKRLDQTSLARLTPFALPDEANTMAPSTCSNRWRRMSRACKRAERRSSLPCGVKAPATAWQACSGTTGLPTSPASIPGARCKQPRATRRCSPCSAWRPASRPTTLPSSASRTFSATAWCGRERRAASSTISFRKSRA